MSDFNIVKKKKKIDTVFQEYRSSVLSDVVKAEF